MDLNAEFLQSLNEAFLSERLDLRNRANAQLLGLAARDPNLLLSHAVKGFCNAELAGGLRALCATFLGGMLMPRESEARRSIWPQLSAAAKESLKEACLTQLADADAGVMRAAAALVAAVFALDCVSDNAWEQLLPSLGANVENSDVRIQKAAVTSLGNICDLLNKHKIADLSEQRVDLLLTGICKGLRRYNALTETAVQALDDSLQFLRAKLDSDAIADFVMELLVTVLKEAQAAPEGAEAERRLLYCLAKICKIVFARLERYRRVLFDAALGSYRRSEPGVAVACNGFFTAMIRLDERHRARHMDGYWKSVMELCLKRLSESEDLAEEDEGAGGSLQLSVLDAMTAINRVYFELTAEVVKGFIAAYIELKADDKKIMALVAFESMLEMPRSEGLFAFVNSGFYGILSLLQSGTPPVRRAANRLLMKIIRTMPEIFFTDVNFHKAMKLLLAVMQAPAKGELEVHFQYTAANMISELTCSAKALPGGLALLRSSTDQLFDIVCSVALASENLTVIDSYFSVVFDFVQRVVDAKYLGDYLLSFAAYLKTLQDRGHKHQLYIFEFLFINMTVIVTQIKKANVKFFSHSAQDSALFLRELYEAVARACGAAGKVVSEALLLMATILTYDSVWGRAQLPGFLQGYVLPALQDYQASDLFKSAAESLAVCCKTFEAETERFVAEIYPYFISLLANDLVQRELKVTLFFALADFALHCQTASAPYLAETLRLAELALDAVLHFQKSEQEELQEYAEVFKETLIDFFLCVVHGMYAAADEADAAIEQSLRRVFGFIRQTNTAALNPTINYQNSCLGLLIDFYAKKKMPQLVDIELVTSLFRSLQKHANYADVGGTLDYARKNFSSL